MKTPPASVTFSGDGTEWLVTASTSPITGTARTANVPAGNAGVVALNITKSGTGTMQRSINGGTFATFVNGATVTLANGDTLNFRATSASSGFSMVGAVVDAGTSSGGGPVDIERS